MHSNDCGSSLLCYTALGHGQQQCVSRHRVVKFASRLLHAMGAAGWMVVAGCVCMSQLCLYMRLCIAQTLIEEVALTTVNRVWSAHCCHVMSVLGSDS
jgi:hypothetical protein